MKKILTHLLAFILGAVAYQVTLIILFGTWDYKPKSGGVGISDAYVRSHFREVCDVLESNGCGCYPVVHTDRNCKTLLNKILLDKEKKAEAERSE